MNTLSRCGLLSLCFLLAAWTPYTVSGQINVSLPVASGNLGDTPLLPVTTGDLTGEDVFGFDFTFTFDPTIVTITGISTSGTLTSDCSVQGNSPAAGQFVVSAGCTTAPTGAGTLVNLQAEYVGGGTGPLSWSAFSFNEGQPPATTSNGSVTVTVVDNEPPNAGDDADSTDEESSVEIDVLADDSDNVALDASTVTVTSGPSNGGTSVHATTGAITYTPDADFNGQDSFTYTVDDTNGNTSNAATVTVTINPVNDAPGFTATDPPSVIEDSGPQTVNAWAVFEADASAPGDANEAGQSVQSYTVGNVSSPGLFSAGPSVAANGTLTYTPAANASGTSTFEVTVQDDGDTANGGQDTSAPQTFTITVDPENDPPTFTSTPLDNASQDQPYSYTATAEDVDGDALTLSAPTLPSWLNFTDNGDGTGTLSGTPTAGEIGDHDVVLEVSDGVASSAAKTSATAQQSFTITVMDNLPPVANDDDATTPEDEAVVIEVLDNDTDPENDALDASTVTVTSGPSNGGTSVHATTGAITYTPEADFSGTDSFTYTVEDANGATSNTATVTVTVTSEDDPPIAHDDATSTQEDDSATIDVLSNDAGDRPLVPQTVVITDGPAHGEAVLASAATGAIRYTPAPDYYGTDSFTYTVDDTNGATSNAATVTINVAPVEDAPAFEDTSNPPPVAIIGEPYSYTVEAEDADGDPITLSATTLPSWLTFTDNGDGTGLLEGTPSNEDEGEHDVVLEASDGSPASAAKISATTQFAFSIVVIREALATIDDEAEVDEDGAVAIEVLANDAGSLISSSLAVATPPAHGNAHPDATTGRITYTPAADYFGTDAFTYTVENEAGTVSQEATVTVTVHPRNDPPLPPPDPVITAPEDGSGVLIGGSAGAPPEDPEAAFIVEWQPFTDVDDENSALTYTWELALTETFSVPLQQVEVGTSTRMTSTLGEVAELLNSQGIALNGEVTVYHRVTVSDGEASTVSAAYSVTLTRGTLTDRQDSDDIPERFVLQSNYPNPFNPVTVIEYAVPEAVFVTIRVYSALGEEVATLVAAPVAPGQYQVRFDARGLASGIYFYRMEAGAHVAMKKMLLLK